MNFAEFTVALTIDGEPHVSRYSPTGIRAVTIYLLREAKRQGWSAETVEREAKKCGFDLSSAPALLRFVHDYLR